MTAAVLEAAPLDYEEAPELELFHPNLIAKHTKRYSKCVDKMGLIPDDVYDKVRFRKDGSLTFVVNHPMVFRYPNKDIFFVFGEARLDYSNISDQESAARFVTGMDSKEIIKELTDPRSIRAPRYCAEKSPLLEPIVLAESSVGMTPIICGMSQRSEISILQTPDSAGRNVFLLENTSQTSANSQMRQKQRNAKKSPQTNGKHQRHRAETRNRSSRKMKTPVKQDKKTKNPPTPTQMGSPKKGQDAKKGEHNEEVDKSAKTIKSDHQASHQEWNNGSEPHSQKQKQGNAHLHQEVLGGFKASNTETHNVKELLKDPHDGHAMVDKKDGASRASMERSSEKNAKQSNWAKQNTHDADVHHSVHESSAVKGAAQKSGQEKQKEAHRSNANKYSDASVEVPTNRGGKHNSNSSVSVKNGGQAQHAKNKQGKGKNVSSDTGTWVLRRTTGPSGQRLVRTKRPLYDDGEGEEEEKCEFDEVDIFAVMSNGGVTRGTAIRALRRNKGDLLESVLELTLDVTY